MSPISLYIYQKKIDFTWDATLFLSTSQRFISSAPVFFFDAQTKTRRESPYFKFVQTPQEADFILFPEYLDRYLDLWNLDWELITQKISELPYFHLFPHKHIFFCDHDLWQPIEIPSLFLCASMHQDLQSKTVIAFPYGSDPALGRQVSDLSPLSKHQHAISYDTCFVGGVHRKQRQILLQSIEAETQLNSFIRKRLGFWGHSRIKKERVEFLKALASSFTALCPRGNGHNSIRFFEVLSAGKVPVLISDNCSLPFAEKIPYDDFMIRIPEAEIANAGQILFQKIQEIGYEELLRKGQLAQEYYQKELSLEQWPRQLHNILQSYLSSPK